MREARVWNGRARVMDGQPARGISHSDAIHARATDAELHGGKPIRGLGCVVPIGEAAVSVNFAMQMEAP